MSQRSLIALALCIMIAMAFLAFGGGGDRVAERLDTLLEVQAKGLAADRDTFAANDRIVREALDGDPELFRAGGYTQRWPQRLDEASMRIEEAEQRLTNARALFAEKGASAAAEVERELAAVSASSAAAQQAAAEMAVSAAERVELKRALPRRLAEIEADTRAASAVSLPTLRAKVAAAVAEWPQKQADLERRLTHLERVLEETETAWQQTQAAAAGGPEGVDYDTIATNSRLIHEHRNNLESGAPRLLALIGELYVSWDEVLADMEIREGQTVTFYHSIQRVETPSAAAAEAGEPRVQQQWKQVSESVYKANEKNLGMTLRHKAAGVYDTEAVEAVQPAGYAYIASPQEGRNRYGEWRHRPGGGSFWVFYGQYSLMRDLFWGRGGYRPIVMNDYRRYDTARRSGRAWYGEDRSGKARYGSRGTLTKTRYATSRYQRTGGYRNSRYMKSGGTYRGSRYEQRRRTSTSRSRTSRGFGRFGRSRSSGGRRFGGFGK